MTADPHFLTIAEASQRIETMELSPVVSSPMAASLALRVRVFCVVASRFTMAAYPPCAGSRTT